MKDFSKDENISVALHKDALNHKIQPLWSSSTQWCMKDHHLALLLQLLFPSRLNFNKVTIFQSLHSINKYECTYCNCSSCPPPVKFVNATTHLTAPEVASEMTALLLEMLGTSTDTRNLGDFAFTVAENADTTYVVIHGHHGMLRQNLDHQIWALSQNDVLGFVCIFAHQIWPCPRPNSKVITRRESCGSSTYGRHDDGHQNDQSQRAPHGSVSRYCLSSAP